MARYRLYTNGIYGKRYKNFYICMDKDAENGSKYYVVDEHKETVADRADSFEDAMWEIDKMVMHEGEVDVVMGLFEEDLNMLNKTIIQLIRKKDDGVIKPEELILLDWAQKVRDRKNREKGF